MVTSTSKQFIEGLTFDDVLLRPGYSDFKRQDISLKTYLTKKIMISIPFSSAPMDIVTESGLAISLARMGGIGFIHRNLTIENQVKEVLKVKKEGLLVGAAIGSEGYDERIEKLIKVGVDAVIIDTAHGYAKTVLNAISAVKNKYKDLQVISGNIATKEGALASIKAGADGLRVGMGPGAICTTRIVSGVGIPQMTALLEIGPVAKKYKVPVIADGGITYSGDMVKALAAGASTIMMGSFFASCEEAPGEKVLLAKQHVPLRFKDILKIEKEKYMFKTYRGMGSVGAMHDGAKIKSEGEYHGKSYSDRTLVAEGVEGLVPIKGTVPELLDQALGGIKSGMYYVGARDICSLHKIAQFVRISQASLKESHPHDILVTNPGKSYQ
ncbi:MAG: IMP dehydrogenase [Candidatus Roizmanbacteria bacterium]|nr:IMP dehydrogenase [Candidatus Roizmanbacteria bacterium]